MDSAVLLRLTSEGSVVLEHPWVPCPTGLTTLLARSSHPSRRCTRTQSLCRTASATSRSIAPRHLWRSGLLSSLGCRETKPSATRGGGLAESEGCQSGFD